MKELNRYDFTNGKAFITRFAEVGDPKVSDLPECDVIFLTRAYEDGQSYTWAMRPDEALILAKLLIDAVWQVTEGYTVDEPKPQELNFGGMPIVSDSSVPKDEIHLRQDGKTEAVLKTTENGECREVWRSPTRRGTDGRPYPNDQ